MQQEEIFQELFQSIKEETTRISDIISQKEECENMEERFAIFYCENSGFYGDHSILLKNLRTIRHIVENELIVIKLNEICTSKENAYKDLKTKILRFGPIITQINTEAWIEHNLDPESSIISYVPSPFHELDIVLKYSEWKKILPQRQGFDEKIIFCGTNNDLINQDINKISYDTFKSLYYVYYAYYDGYYVTKFANNIKAGNIPLSLHLEENKDILKYINDKKETESSSCDLLLPVPNFTKQQIKQLATNLCNHAYITEEEIDTFVGLFLKNKTTYCEERIINWNSGTALLKFLFLKLYNKWDSKEDINDGTWIIVTNVFRKDGKKYGDNTMSNLSKKKIADVVGREADTIIEIINNAKMYKGA